MTRPIAAPLAGLFLVLLPAAALAGLRPQYGGELVLRVTEAPSVLEPSLAWTPSELVVAGALARPLAALATRITTSPAEHRYTVGEEAAQRYATLLTAAHDRAVVSLPPLAFAADGADVVVSLPASLPVAQSAMGWTWLRLPPTPGTVAFASVRRGLEAQQGAARPFLDRVRIDARAGKPGPPAPNEWVLGTMGPGGRPVVALPRPNGPGAEILRATLAALDRRTLARLFVRGPSIVPPDRYDGPAAPARPTETLVIAVDADERDLRTIAQKLQLALRDRRVTARVVSERRPAHLERLLGGAYDIALVALPTAPEEVQAATLLRLAGPARSSALVWARVTQTGGSFLVPALERTGARLLYVEGGAIETGRLVRGDVARVPWDTDLGGLWLLPKDLQP